MKWRYATEHASSAVAALTSFLSMSSIFDVLAEDAKSRSKQKVYDGVFLEDMGIIAE